MTYFTPLIFTVLRATKVFLIALSTKNTFAFLLITDALGKCNG